MNRHHNPSNIHPPAGLYTHTVETLPGARWLHVAGQLGMRPNGTTPEGIEAQAEQAWRNVEAALASAAMDFADLVRVNYYLTDTAHIAPARAVRDRFLKQPVPVATLLVVKSLAGPEWLIEIEATAAKM
jgi:enamine deaminase RidA (YjgF/YER057c/UK114 family)